MTRPTSSDAVGPDLIAAVVRGEPDSLDAWYRREHPAVFRLCLGLLAQAAEAEDAAQDAMLKLVDRLASYDPTRSYSAWRNTVVLNLCRDRLRHLAVQRRVEERPQPARPAPRPEDAAAAGEVRELLQRALSSLSPREREAFVLRDLEGRPTAEAALVLGVGESTVRSLLTLARRRLRQILGPALSPTGADR